MNLKKINKKEFWIFLTIVLAIFIIIFIAFSTKNKDTSIDKLKYNKNYSFTKKQKVEGIVFKNIKCTFDGKNSLISYTMINETKKDIYLNNYDIIVKDKNNVKITKISASLTQNIKPNESLEMANQVVGVDLTDAYSMELKLNKKKNNK